jgi:hypothetical protein
VFAAGVDIPSEQRRSNSAGAKIFPSPSATTTFQPSPAHTRALATAIRTPALRLWTFSFSRSAIIW